MILITITHAREKGLLLMKIALVAILLGLIVPNLYGMLSDAGSLERFAEEEKLPQEPMRVEQIETESEEMSLWSHIVNSFK
ncbi:hypothetical protein [Dehalobacterium formicoaceticum]|uniref:Uncharacterized protein n=1 Tax=Dehalobacterium formicoaceticum TaxID=51515 RepID=A0ABT1Y813_9FIRM|nr:hypothetical protein [Dehalobacterium formicoaceticum]MCR6545816.1 hypothetical protein [Dehalobacterium formicoaceticum]